jgi:cytochrome c
MIGIAGLTFAVAAGRERFAHAATEAPDVSGTRFNPWVTQEPQKELGRHVFAAACVNCHQYNGHGRQTVYASLAGSRSLAIPTAVT